MRKYLDIPLTLIVTLTLTVAMLWPLEAPPPAPEGSDKLVHLVAFIGVGAAVSIAYARSSLIPRHVVAVAVTILAVLTVGTMGVDRVLFPGIIDGIGRLPLALGNGFTSITMAVLVYQTFEGPIWTPRAAGSRQQEA